MGFKPFFFSTDSDSTSQAFGASREIKKFVREHKADTHDPAKGVIEKSSEKDSSSIDSHSSHSRVKPQSSYGVNMLLY